MDAENRPGRKTPHHTPDLLIAMTKSPKGAAIPDIGYGVLHFKQLFFECFGDVSNQFDQSVAIAPFVVIPNTNFNQITANNLC